MMSGPRICTQFKRDLLTGWHAFHRDEFALALYTSQAQLDPDETTAYTSLGEVVAPGYTAGGQVLAHPQILTMGGICFVTFDDPVWPNSTIVARAALVYNYTHANRAVAILDFGSDWRSNNGVFHVQFPPPGPATALIRIV
jgi:hypothetical protein